MEQQHEKETLRKGLYWLFLDDVRQPRDAYDIIQDRRYLDNDQWVCVRNLEEFKDALKEFGIPSLVSYDHDLAPEHYHLWMFDPTPQRYDTLYAGFTEPTGIDCLEHMFEQISEHGTQYPETLIHTQNPVGRRNLQNLKDSHEFEITQKNSDNANK